MKKILGVIFLVLPIVGVIAMQIVSFGIGYVLCLWTVALVSCGLIALGVHFLTEW